MALRFLGGDGGFAESDVTVVGKDCLGVTALSWHTSLVKYSNEIGSVCRDILVQMEST